MQKAEQLYRFEDFRVDVAERALYHGQERLHLTPMVFDTLVALIQQAGRVVSKDDLFARVWPGTFVQESSLSQNIYLLRRALGGDHYIETVPKVGYRFTVPVDSSPGEASVPEPAPPIHATSVMAPPPAEVTPWRRSRLWLAALIPLVVSGFLLWRERNNAAHPVEIRAIAVLPFVSLGDQANQSAVADGLTEQLIYELTRIPRLRVAARTSSSQYKNQARDVRQIGRSLNVDAILEGSVRRDRDTLRITAQLNRTSDGYHLWSRTFDRALPDTLGLQEEIAQSLAESVLGAPVTGGSHSLFLPRNAEAREAYLDGRFQWNFETGIGLTKAVELFKKSIALEPGFAPAHAMLADSYLMLAAYDMANPAEMLPQGKAEAAKALALDPAQPRAFSVLGLAEVLSGEDRALAEQHFLQAIRLSPSTPRYRFLYAFYLLGPAGRLDEADQNLAVAEEADPFSTTVAAGKIGAPFFARDYQRALAAGEKVLKKMPDCFLCNVMEIWTLGGAGRFEESLRMSEKEDQVIGIEFTPALRWRAYCLARLGRRDEVRKIARRLEEISRQRYESPEHFAHVYASLGERDLAIKWLKKAYEQRAFGMSLLDAFPAYDFLRGDPEYERIRAAMRLPRR